MKLYEANYHVRIGYARYRPGEAIEGGLSDVQAARLLRMGAITEVGDIPDKTDPSWEDSGGNGAGELTDHEEAPVPQESGTADDSRDAEDMEAPEEEETPLPPPRSM